MISQVPRSQKLRFYESLFLWNQGVDQVIATLRGMEKFPFARKDIAGRRGGDRRAAC